MLLPSFRLPDFQGDGAKQPQKNSAHAIYFYNRIELFILNTNIK